MLTLKVYNEEASLFHIYEGEAVTIKEELDYYLIRLDDLEVYVKEKGLYTKAWIMNSSGSTVHTCKA